MTTALVLTLVVLASVAWLVGFRDINWRSEQHDFRRVVTIFATAILLLALGSAIWLVVISIAERH